ncbi:MAG: hypothetical protein ACK4PK_07170 [Alphaproteobacteria bacterium]|jgi:hypothetical protein
MAFDWKKKFEEGRQKAADAFANAVVKGEELLEKGEKAAAEFGKEVKAKVDEIKKQDGGPKNG